MLKRTDSYVCSINTNSESILDMSYLVPDSGTNLLREK